MSTFLFASGRIWHWKDFLSHFWQNAVIVPWTVIVIGVSVEAPPQLGADYRLFRHRSVGRHLWLPRTGTKRAQASLLIKYLEVLLGNPVGIREKQPLPSWLLLVHSLRFMHPSSSAKSAEVWLWDINNTEKIRRSCVCVGRGTCMYQNGLRTLEPGMGPTFMYFERRQYSNVLMQVGKVLG